MQVTIGYPRVTRSNFAGSLGTTPRPPYRLPIFSLKVALHSTSNNCRLRKALNVSANSNNPYQNIKNPENKQEQQQDNKSLRGSYSKEPASSDSQWDDVYPLTTLQQNSDTVVESWPTSAARDALYNNVPVDRCDGMHLSIQGKLPVWLKGSLYRNGPGHFKGAHAVFDGCAMIARFKIDGTSESTPSVVVSHRFIETTYLAAARAAGGDVRWTLGHKSGVRRTALERLKYLASLSAGAFTHGVHLGDNALISIFPGAATTASGKKELIAHTETLSGTYRIDPDTLETLGRVEYTTESIGGGSGGGSDEKEKEDNEVSGLGKTAHPHVLPNGDVINLASDFMPHASKAAGARLFRPPHMTLYRNPCGDPSRRIAIAHIPYLRPSSPTWCHQVAVSNNYAVIVQNPCFYGIDNMVFGENSGQYLVFRWDPSAGSLIHVVPLNPKNSASSRIEGIKSFRAPAFLATHWINAFESEGHLGAVSGRGGDGESAPPAPPPRYLNLDGCMAQDPRLMAHWALDTVRSGLIGGKQIEVSLMRRLVIDLDAPEGSFLGSKNTKNVLNDDSFLQKLIPDAAHGYAIELPAIKFSGQRHQFVYAAAAKRPSNCWNALTKADVVNGSVKLWYEAGSVCWEPLFVPRPGAVAEDDGVVLSVIMQANGKSALLVLDGQSFTEIARAVLPYGLSNGFHGCFVPEN